MKVYVPIYTSNYEKYKFDTEIPGIFYKKKHAMKKLIQFVVKERFDLDRYNELIEDFEDFEDENNPCYIISKNKELNSEKDLIDGLYRYVKKDIEKLISLTDDSYYGDTWKIRIDKITVK